MLSLFDLFLFSTMGLAVGCLTAVVFLFTFAVLDWIARTRSAGLAARGHDARTDEPCRFHNPRGASPMKVRVVIGRELTIHDPKDRPALEVELPMGYRRVFTGAVKPRDLSMDWCPEDGAIFWLTPEDDAGDLAEHHMCLIRPDYVTPADNETPLWTPCERCQAYGPIEGRAFCQRCCDIMSGAWKGSKS